MLIETSAMVNTGDTPSDLTANRRVVHRRFCSVRPCLPVGLLALRPGHAAEWLVWPWCEATKGGSGG
jgi:hypothetical protein